MAKNLYILSHHFDNQKYEETAIQMLKNILPEMETYASGFSNWLDLLTNYQSKYYEIVVVGEDALAKTSEINSHYIPNKLVAGSLSENNTKPLLNLRYVDNETLIYVCVNNTCKLPVSDTKKAIEPFIQKK
jgi:uncharacterized protein YyaL (SSP411 family)